MTEGTAFNTMAVVWSQDPIQCRIRTRDHALIIVASRSGYFWLRRVANHCGLQL